MTDEPIDRDAALEAMIREVASDPMAQSVDWAELRRGIEARAASELGRRRRRRRLRVVIPASLAACLALLLVSQAVEQTSVDATRDRAAVSVEPVTIDELLDADVSEGQFRALLAGAADADDLLMIAAEERQP